MCTIIRGRLNLHLLNITRLIFPGRDQQFYFSLDEKKKLALKLGIIVESLDRYVLNLVNKLYWTLFLKSQVHDTIIFILNSF